jgi:hypothetical protein
MLDIYETTTKRKKYQYMVLVDWVPTNIKLFLEKTMCIDSLNWHIEELYASNKALFLVYFKNKEDAERFSYCADPQRI